MTKISKKEEGTLVPQDAPHYFQVYIEDHPFGANTRSCGTQKDLESVLKLYPGSRWEKIYLPHTPDTVDVMYVETGKEQVLQAQQVLQPSDAEPFNAST